MKEDFIAHKPWDGKGYGAGDSVGRRKEGREREKERNAGLKTGHYTGGRKGRRRKTALTGYFGAWSTWKEKQAGNGHGNTDTDKKLGEVIRGICPGYV